MSLRDLLTNPFPDPPESVVKAAQRYKREGENYNIFPEHAFIDGRYYYLVTYFEGEKRGADYLLFERNEYRTNSNANKQLTFIR